MDPDSKWGFRQSYRDARRRVKDALKPPSPQPSSPDANLPSHAPSSASSPLATSISGTARDAGSAACAGLVMALEVLKESTDVFPPLKSVVSGLLACLDVLQVGTYNFIDGWHTESVFRRPPRTAMTMKKSQ
jgi:hypothetical protein